MTDPAKVPTKGSVEIKLQYPVEYDDKTYDTIVLKRPKGKHLKKLPQDPRLEDLLILAVKCSGLPNGVFDNMDGADCITVTEQIGDFLESGQKIGKL